MEWLDKLMQTAAPDGTPASLRDAERAIGNGFPDSYVSLVDAYGAGYFDDFLYLLSLNNSNKYLDVSYQTCAQREALRAVSAGGERPPSRIKSIDDLFVWAMTDNGDVCCWMPSDEEGCVAIMDSRAHEWCFYDMSITEFLYKLPHKDIVVSVFPPDFPGSDHVFSRL